MKQNTSNPNQYSEIVESVNDFPRLTIAFKNLDKSELAQEIVKERMSEFYIKFPNLRNHDVRICLSMDNSFIQAGPDLFTAKLIVQGPHFRRLILAKSAPNLYEALADLDGHLLERLNRAGDRRRIKNRNQERKLMQKTYNDSE